MVRRRNLQYVHYIATARVPGTHSVFSACPRSTLQRTIDKFNDNFRFRIEAMHMAGRMVFQIRNKANSFEAN